MSICNTVYSTEPEVMKLDIEDISKGIEKIAKHVHKWALFYLVSSTTLENILKHLV
jgi:hypothetical protein